jgi:hypothetical protein
MPADAPPLPRMPLRHGTRGLAPVDRSPSWCGVPSPTHQRAGRSGQRERSIAPAGGVRTRDLVVRMPPR